MWLLPVEIFLVKDVVWCHKKWCYVETVELLHLALDFSIKWLRAPYPTRTNTSLNKPEKPGIQLRQGTTLSSEVVRENRSWRNGLRGTEFLQHYNQVQEQRTEQKTWDHIQIEADLVLGGSTAHGEHHRIWSWVPGITRTQSSLHLLSSHVEEIVIATGNGKEFRNDLKVNFSWPKETFHMCAFSVKTPSQTFSSLKAFSI